MPDLPNLAILFLANSTSDLRSLPQRLRTIKMVVKGVMLGSGLSEPQFSHL